MLKSCCVFDVCESDLIVPVLVWRQEFGGKHHEINHRPPVDGRSRYNEDLPGWSTRPCTRLTGGEPRSSPGRLHLLPRVGEHVVALGFVDQITTGLRRLNQLLVVHHVQQVGRVDEGKTHHRQQLRQILELEGGREDTDETVHGELIKEITESLLKK